METFLFKLAVAVIPLILLVTSVTFFSDASRRHSRNSLVWQRNRRQILRSLAHGAMLR